MKCKNCKHWHPYNKEWGSCEKLPSEIKNPATLRFHSCEVRDNFFCGFHNNKEGMDDDVFSGWNDFPKVKPDYDFDAVVELVDGQKRMASWKDDRWNFAKPGILDCDVKRWMALL
jgi:hypothetical protein